MNDKNYWPAEMDIHIDNWNVLPMKPDDREAHFNDLIYPKLLKLAENVINRYKFDYLGIDYKSVQLDVVSYMASKLYTYDKNKGKSFSYMTFIARNYLIGWNTKNYKTNQILLPLELEKEDDESNYMPSYLDKLGYDDKDWETNYTLKEFIPLAKLWWDKQSNSIFNTKQHKNKIGELFYQLVINESPITRDGNINKKCFVDVGFASNGHRGVKYSKKMFEINRKLYEYFCNFGSLPESHEKLIEATL